MRLAVVSPFVDRRHGTERALAELLQRLALGYHCEIHLYSQQVEDLSLNPPGAPRPEESGAIFWHKVPSVPGPHLLQFSAWFYLNRLKRYFDRFFRRISFDLVLSPGINCKDADIVIVHALFHRLRELAAEERDDFESQHSFFRRLHRRMYYGLVTHLERRVYSDPNVSLTAVSERTAKLLEEYFHRGDVHVIPNAVDTAQFSLSARLARRAESRRRRNLADNDFVLLLIGNDWRVKGLGTVLEAMASISDLPVQLLVVGNDAPEYFKARAKDLGVPDRCHWETPRDDVLEFYAAADAYVSPTREDAFALPPLEAMACGLPVITSVNNGGSQIITEGTDGFILSDPCDRIALANLLRRLFQQPDLRRRIGENAARTALAYTWERNAAAVWKLLEGAAARKRSCLLPGST